MPCKQQYNIYGYPLNPRTAELCNSGGWFHDMGDGQRCFDMQVECQHHEFCEDEFTAWVQKVRRGRVERVRTDAKT